MTAISPVADRYPFMSALLSLVRTVQAYEHTESKTLRHLGITTAQMDILFTLGNTPGMSFGRLSDKTLITKGTLTGVVDRLEAKGLVSRSVPPNDRRSVIIRLTEKGEKLFDALFENHLKFLSTRFDGLNEQDQHTLVTLLDKLLDGMKKPIKEMPHGDKPWHEFV